MTMAVSEQRRARPRRHRELKPEQLRRRLDPARLGFASTADVEPLLGTIGQPRALDALEFGLETETRGFNVFVAGAPGSGRLTTVLDDLQTRAASKPVADDWIYVHNFRNADQPNAIRLPAGGGSEFARAMDEFVETARREIPRAFETEEYERRQREVLAEIAAQQEGLEGELTRFAAERELAIKTSLTGVASMPLVEGKPITREQFEQLPEERRHAITAATEEVHERAGSYLHQLRQLEKEAVNRVQELDRDVALFATEPLFHELEQRFGAHPEVLSYLADVKDNVLNHLSDFREPEEPVLPFGLGAHRPDYARFRVNVFVDNDPAAAAPVVVERNPSYYNLLGRIEYRAALGSMVTDFREIKPGALHRANGGFLIVDMLDLLRHPFAWEALKRALRSAETRIENLGAEYSALPSATLRPEPIPLAVKVVLLGSPLLYTLLYELDEAFRELFKVKADFAPEIGWTSEHHRNYARFISRCVNENELHHFDAAAVGRVIEYGARLRENQRKLSARLLVISDLVSEASFWAEKQGHELVGAGDVDHAIRQAEYRSNLLEERVQELINDGTIVIETEGSASAV
jgi:predicted ATP-dependent protease